MRYLFTILLFAIAVTTAVGQDGIVDGNPAIAYWKVGHKKEIVIALHGGPAAAHGYLRPEFDGLSGGATVVYYDQRGVGKSPETETYTWQEHVNDLRRLIETVSKRNKVFLAGSSWGSILAILYAYTYPNDVKGLMLSGTVNWQGQNLSPTQFETYRDKYYLDRKPLTIAKVKLQENRLVAGEKPEEQPKIVQIEKEVEIYAGPQMGETRIGWATAPVLDSLRNIKTPVLLFNGDSKNCFVDWAHRYVTIFPNAELVTIPAACHDPWFSDPGLFVKSCLAFIKKNERGGHNR